MEPNRHHVMILGSAPDALRARHWSRKGFTHIVAINNAWRIRPDWDFLIHPEDFPVENRPKALNSRQRIVTAQDYVPIQNTFGGFVYAGGTMAFTAGYWALAALKPAVVAYLGCDMVYPQSGKSHFYGRGAADPLRRDVTLRSLSAKSARLALFGAAQRCRIVRLSSAESRLIFPSVSRGCEGEVPLPYPKGMGAVLKREAKLGYFEPTGRYWDKQHEYDPAKIDALDQLWLETYKTSCTDRVD